MCELHVLKFMFYVCCVWLRLYSQVYGAIAHYIDDAYA